MANTVYSLYKQSLLAGDADADLDNAGSTIAPFCGLNTAAGNNSHQFYSSMASTLVGTDQQITSPTVALGLFDGADLTYTAVTAGPAVNTLVIYRKNTGANTTWRLVCWIDTATGLPVTPNGGNITVTWNASGIFQL